MHHPSNTFAKRGLLLCKFRNLLAAHCRQWNFHFILSICNTFYNIFFRFLLLLDFFIRWFKICHGWSRCANCFIIILCEERVNMHIYKYSVNIKRWLAEETGSAFTFNKTFSSVNCNDIAKWSPMNLWLHEETYQWRVREGRKEEKAKTKTNKYKHWTIFVANFLWFKQKIKLMGHGELRFKRKEKWSAHHHHQ